MKLADIVDASARVQATRARLEKLDHLAALLRRLRPAEVPIVTAWLSGRLRQGRIGLGPSVVRAARPPDAAQESTLTPAEVDETFDKIAAAKGAGSQRERTSLLGDLLRRATAAEQDFLVRLVFGELRQGALAGQVVEAVARAAEVPVADVRRAVMLAGDLEQVACTALSEGAPGLARFRLELFRPLQPMLAQPVAGVGEAFAKVNGGELALEYKLDGARVQVHRDGDDVRVWSRRLNDVTAAVPELVEIVRGLPVRSLILDGEVLALRPDGAPHPFQVTMRRFGRRLEVDELRASLPLTPFFFDVLHAGGEDLFDRPARERFSALEQSAPDTIVRRLLTADAGAADAFVREALGRGHEGVMAKSPGAIYEAGSRGSAWLKIKPAHTLDLVVLAAEWGSGRRSGWLSNLHLGARDPATGGFVMLGKTFKGMTDAMLQWQTKRFQEIAVATDEYTVHVRPEVVVEIAFSDIQRSSQYPGGMALRFARIKRYRDDKRPEDADTVQTVRRILDRTAGLPPER